MVVGFFGALLGSAVVYILPGVMYRAAARRSAAAEGKTLPAGGDYLAAGLLIWVSLRGE